MRLDRANRCFLAAVTIALSLGALVLCGAVGGVLAPLVLARVARAPAGATPPGASLLAFCGIVALGLARGGRSLAAQLLASRRLALRVRALLGATPAELHRAAIRAGLAGRVVLVEAPEPFSFVHGVLTPRVVVSRGLLEGASRRELHAVLEHERYHVRNLDPLKAVAMRSLAAALFLLPVLDRLSARYLAGRELAADRRAVEICGRDSLASALLRVLRNPPWSGPQVAAAIGGTELLDARVAQLETGREPRLATLGRARLLLSLLGVLLLAGCFLLAVHGLGGPAAVSRATGAGLAQATVLGSLTCTAPAVAVAAAAYLLLAIRARRALADGRARRFERSMRAAARP